MQELAGIKNDKINDLNKLETYLKTNHVDINNNLKYIGNNGKIKINSNEVYDFGGSWNPIPNSIVVDFDKPEGDNEFIKQDLEKQFNLSPKKYINLTSVLHFINNKSNLIKSINNSLKPGGIILIKSSLRQILEIIPHLSHYTPLEAKIDKEEITKSEDNPDAISIVFQK